MLGTTTKIKTFSPPINVRGRENEFEGTRRKSELRGIIKINQKTTRVAIHVRDFAPQKR